MIGGLESGIELTWMMYNLSFLLSATSSSTTTAPGASVILTPVTVTLPEILFTVGAVILAGS